MTVNTVKIDSFSSFNCVQQAELTGLGFSKTPRILLTTNENEQGDKNLVILNFFLSLSVPLSLLHP